MPQGLKNIRDLDKLEHLSLSRLGAARITDDLLRDLQVHSQLRDLKLGHPDGKPRKWFRPATVIESVGDGRAIHTQPGSYARLMYIDIHPAIHRQ